MLACGPCGGFGECLVFAQELDEKARELNASSSKFEDSAGSLRRSIVWRNRKLMLIIAAVIIIVILFIVAIIAMSN